MVPEEGRTFLSFPRKSHPLVEVSGPPWVSSLRPVHHRTFCLFFQKKKGVSRG